MQVFVLKRDLVSVLLLDDVELHGLRSGAIWTAVASASLSNFYHFKFAS